MEPKDTNSQSKETFFEKYPYLEPLLNYYDLRYDKVNITMDDYIIILNRIILKYQKNSIPEMVDEIKNFFIIIIKNSIRMNRDSILFKALSYFIKEGFDHFISTLKIDKIITLPKFMSGLFSKVNEKKIAKSFNLDKIEVETELKLITLKKALKDKKFNLKQKLGGYIFLFFRDFIEQKDEEIKVEIFKYIKEKDWNGFYERYENFKIIDDFDRKLSSILGKESSEQNEIKGEGIAKNAQNSQILEKSMNILNINTSLDKDAQDNPEDSQNSELKSTETNNGSNDQKSIGTNNGNSEQKNTINGNSEQKITEMSNGDDKLKNIEIINLNKEQKSSGMNDEKKNIPCMKEIKVLNNEQLSEKYIQLSERFNKFMELFEEQKKHSEKLEKNDEEQKNEIESLKKRINEVSDKLDLAILINNLSTQRDCYKKTLEILLKYLNKELHLNVVLFGDDIWKQTKIIIDKILECGLSDENRQNLANALKGLLFCKDYANCLVHGKSTASEELNKYYKDNNEIPIITTASYENMKYATINFFDEKVNKGEFKIINNFLFQKVQKWKNDNEIDFSKYISKNKLDYEILLKHFSIVENIVEKFALKTDIDKDLFNN